MSVKIFAFKNVFLGVIVIVISFIYMSDIHSANIFFLLFCDLPIYLTISFDEQKEGYLQ